MKLHKTMIHIMAFIMILLTCPASANPNKGSDQMPKRTSQRIIGGHEAAPGAWPWMAALIYNGNAHFCGGSLIHSRWVVTAAHCVYYRSAEHVEVAMGVHDITTEKGDRIKVRTSIIHPDYDYDTDNLDIALLELETDASQEPIDLTAKDSILEGEEGITLGWGVINAETLEYPDTLQQVSVPIVSNDVCGQAFGDGEITENMVCAGHARGGKDACRGDSGGPLIVYDDDAWKLAGVVSWGEGCAEPGYYGVYARIPHLIDFVDEYVPYLDIRIPKTATEGDGTIQGVVSIRKVSDEDTVLNLISDNPSEVTVPESITIASGEASAVFGLTIIDDAIHDKVQTITITASASGHADARDVIQVTDDDPVPIPGDLDHSRTVDLQDAILAAEVLAGMTVHEVHSDADVSDDGKIGEQELIFILQTLILLEHPRRNKAS